MDLGLSNIELVRRPANGPTPDLVTDPGLSSIKLVRMLASLNVDLVKGLDSAASNLPGGLRTASILIQSRIWD